MSFCLFVCYYCVNVCDVEGGTNGVRGRERVCGTTDSPIDSQPTKKRKDIRKTYGNSHKLDDQSTDQTLWVSIHRPE